MRKIVTELKRVMAQGRIRGIVCDNTLINGKKYPVVADLTKICIEEGFIYRDKIIWIKPERLYLYNQKEWSSPTTSISNVFLS